MPHRVAVLGLLVLSAGAVDSIGACAQLPPAAAGTNDRPAAESALVIFGDDTVRAEVASTGDQRSRGLSHRADVPMGTGMLFVFDRTEERTFWMRDTLVDLDIAFLDEDYVIQEILHMKAETMDLHDSSVPVFMALEVPGGWFGAHGIDVGSRAEIVFPTGR